MERNVALKYTGKNKVFFGIMAGNNFQGVEIHQGGA
jgi:hypothetical protein